jgi:tRNA-binding EMAP/Myf-like protein
VRRRTANVRPVTARGVIVGRVVRVRPHPGGENIWLADVDTGIDGPIQIVWGGMHIVKEGDLVPVAQPGTRLPATEDKPNPYKIRRRRYRGEISEGMLCSLAELGWDSSVTDRVALLDGSLGLQVGESLESRYVNGRDIVRVAADIVGAGSRAVP